MKKQYMEPRMEAIKIKNQCRILSGSTTPDQWGAPEFTPDQWGTPEFTPPDMP